MTEAQTGMQGTALRGKRQLSDGWRLTLTLLVLGVAVIAATTVARGYSWKELGSYGDAPDYLRQARTCRPGAHHMPLYGWTVGTLHVLTFRVPPIEAVGVTLSLASLILAANAIRSLLLLDHIPPARAFWIALALSVFPARHFVYATRILADSMVFLFVVLGYLLLQSGKGHRANLYLCGAALTHDLAAVLWIPAALDHMRRRAWGPLLSSPLIFLPSLALILTRALSVEGVSRWQYDGRPIFTAPLVGLLKPPFDQPWLNVASYASVVIYGALYGWALYRSARSGARQAFWFSVAPFVVLLCLREYVLYYAFDRFLVLSFPALAALLSSIDFTRLRDRVVLAFFALVWLASTTYFIWSFPSSDVRERFQKAIERRPQEISFVERHSRQGIPGPVLLEESEI